MNNNENNNYVNSPFIVKHALISGFVYKIDPIKNGQGALIRINNSYRNDKDNTAYSSWCNVIFPKAMPGVLNIPPHTLVNIICDVAITYKPEQKMNDAAVFGRQISVVPTKNIAITNTYEGGNNGNTNNANDNSNGNGNGNAGMSVGSSDYGNNYGNYDFNDFSGNSPY